MIYMVEMDLGDKSLLPQFHEWYSHHLQMLLSIPGIVTAQRFESVSPTPSPFLAVYGLANPGVLDSPAYKGKAGPDSTKEWKPRLTNWYRNILSGGTAPVVSNGGWLALYDRRTNKAPALPAGYTRLTPEGLDRTVVERGMLVGAAGTVPPAPQADEDLVVRVYRPLTEMLKSAA